MDIMKVNSINNNNTNFGKLTTILCNGYNYECTNLETTLKKELINLSKRNDFFKKNDVIGDILVRNGQAIINLQYNPVPKNFIEKLVYIFKEPENLNISAHYNCSIDAVFFLSKKLREAHTTEDLFNLSNENEIT